MGTGGALTFILMILGLGSLPAAYTLVIKWELGILRSAVVLIMAFYAMAGFFAFTFSITALAASTAAFLLLIRIVIRCLRSTWSDADEPDLEVAHAGDHAAGGRQGAWRSGKALAALLGLGGHCLALIMRVFNFVMQALLISYAIGDVRGLKKEVRSYFAWSFDLSVSM